MNRKNEINHKASQCWKYIFTGAKTKEPEFVLENFPKIDDENYIELMNLKLSKRERETYQTCIFYVVYHKNELVKAYHYPRKTLYECLINRVEMIKLELALKNCKDSAIHLLHPPAIMGLLKEEKKGTITRENYSWLDLVVSRYHFNLMDRVPGGEIILAEIKKEYEKEIPSLVMEAEMRLI